MNLAQIPRRGYLQAPTPLEPLHNLTRFLGGKTQFWIKRDDLLPGCGGGNKTRKLDFSFAEAIAQGADTVITCGAVQSNHCRLTLSWAVKEKMPCHLVLEERVQDSYSPSASGNNLLFHLMGVAGITVVPGKSNMLEEMEKVAEKLKKSGRKPFIIPGGASNATGALGYVACAQEIQEQLFESRVSMDHIVVPSGSAGTHAGMVVGLEGTNANIEVTGINVSRSKEDQENLVYNLALLTAQKAGVAFPPKKEAINCFADYVGPGYSLPTNQMVEAVKTMAQEEAILMDPAGPVVIKIAHPNVPQHPMGKCFIQFKNLVEERSKDYASTDLITDGPIGMEAAEALKSSGIIGLGYIEIGFRNIWNNKKTIQSLEDAKGLKIRSTPSKAHIATLKALGMNPTPISWGEVYTALQQKTVDGIDIDLNLAWYNNFPEVNNNLTIVNSLYSPHLVMMSKKFLDSLSGDDQKMLLDTFQEVKLYERKLIREGEEEILAKLKEKGVNVTVLSREERARWARETASVYEQFEDRIGKELIEKVRKTISQQN
ncbi:unnamed protein product [Cyprideis torosa]|uniref:Tryptophan synthase beta chain-like PALP domain-containing protein n=1 Tax=Cyprideis torosa TaxID=163714 RepID=A0A7R8ZX77_9CRUS|nr:unnamed protein product [Cyprideis torosa]CAG0906346.1 unnamed protein product [Cyprideis torosa]